MLLAYLRVSSRQPLHHVTVRDCLKSGFHDYSLTNIMKGEKTSLVVEAEHGDNIPNQDVETGDLEAESDRIEVNIAVGLFVAAIYDNAWHVGKIRHR